MASDSAPKLIVVFGATGHQGGPVARALHGDTTFKVRAVTRNAESSKALALKEAGMNVVQADMLDVSSLGEAMDGAYGVFLVTSPDGNVHDQLEIQQGTNVANVCRDKEVQHVVFSSQPEGTIGKNCALVDNKMEMEAYMKTIGLPLTAVSYTFYHENLMGHTKPKKIADTVYTLDIPMEGKQLNIIPVSECGECIRQIFLSRGEYIGKALTLSTQTVTIDEMAATLNKHLDGVKFIAGKITAKEYSALNFPGAQGIGEMFGHLQTLKAGRTSSVARALNPQISDFDTWVANNRQLVLSVI